MSGEQYFTMRKNLKFCTHTRTKKKIIMIIKGRKKNKQNPKIGPRGQGFVIFFYFLIYFGEEFVRKIVFHFGEESLT